MLCRPGFAKLEHPVAASRSARLSPREAAVLKIIFTVPILWWSIAIGLSGTAELASNQPMVARWSWLPTSTMTGKNRRCRARASLLHRRRSRDIAADRGITLAGPRGAVSPSPAVLDPMLAMAAIGSDTEPLPHSPMGAEMSRTPRCASIGSLASSPDRPSPRLGFGVGWKVITMRRDFAAAFATHTAGNLSYSTRPMTIRRVDFAPYPARYRLEQRGSHRRTPALRQDRASRPAKSGIASQHQHAFATIPDLR
jgi:hypothetical protein